VSFEWPLVLLALLLVPLGVLAYLAAQRRRMRYATRFTNLEVLAGVLPKCRPGAATCPPPRRCWRSARWCSPSPDPHASVAVPRERATIMLATDSSISMDATDVEPDALRRRAGGGAHFVGDVPDQIRLGLVSFDQAASLLATPTRDHDQVVARSTAAHGPGTATGDALKEAVDAIRRDAAGQAERPPAAIVLLSDGKTTSGRDPLAAAQEAPPRRHPRLLRRAGHDEGTISLGPGDIPIPRSGYAASDRSVCRAWVLRTATPIAHG
jgi:Ca-activated chloride channel family protein